MAERVTTSEDRECLGQMIGFCALGSSPELGCQTVTEAVGRGGEGDRCGLRWPFPAGGRRFRGCGVVGGRFWGRSDCAIVPGMGCNRLGLTSRSGAQICGTPYQRADGGTAGERRSVVAGAGRGVEGLAASWPRATAVAGASRFA